MALLTVRQWAPLMRQRVKIAPFSSYDSQGEPAFGADVVYQAAVIGEMKLVRNAQGQEAPSQQVVYLMSATAVHPHDRITLSTQDVASTERYALQPPIVAVGRYPFLRGQFFTELRLK